MNTISRCASRLLVAGALTLTSVLLAESPSEALQLGKTSYHDGDYKGAFDHLRQAFRNDPGNLEVNLLLGLAALRTGNYETAAAAFDRVLAMRPDLDRARLELARTYYYLQLYSVAEDLFRDVADNPETPDAVREKIDTYLKAIAHRTRTQQLSGALSLSVVRDSNARVSPDGTIDIPGLPPLTVPTERDWFLAQSLVLDHRWKPELSRESWQTGLLAYNAFYDTEDDLNVTYVRLDSGPVFHARGWTAGLAGNAAFMEKDHDRYLGTIGGRAWGAIDVGDNMVLRLEWRGEERRYWQEKLADGFSHTLCLRPTYAVGRHAIIADLGVETHDGDAGYETYDKWFARLAYQLSLPRNLTVLASYAFEDWLFESPDILQNQRRRDHVHEFSLGVRKRLSTHVAVDARHTFETSHSNTDLYDFNRNVTSLSLTVAF